MCNIDMLSVCLTECNIVCIVLHVECLVIDVCLDIHTLDLDTRRLPAVPGLKLFIRCLELKHQTAVMFYY